MNAVAAALGLTGALATCGPAAAETETETETDEDPFLEAERQQQADRERLRKINTGTVQFIDEPAPPNELHTRMSLTVSADSIDSGWVAMRQCQSGLDVMPLSEIVYRYAEINEFRIVSTRNIDSAVIDGPGVQLHGVQADAEICVSAQVKILHAFGNGQFRITSGPYHRRFFDGYFPMTLNLDIRYPAKALEWRTAAPRAQRGFGIESVPGHIAVDTRFAGMLTVTLEFALLE